MPPLECPPDAFPAPAQNAGLADGHGRRFSYLRLSVTDRCNFRCTYCLPNGFKKQAGLAPELSVEEMARAVRAFAALGLWKLRLTGGEPTVRHDFTAITRAMSEVPGVRRLAMTTNGYRLAERAQEWRDAGLDAVNVSIDTLDPAGFARVTGHDRLADVVGGVDRALEAGFDAVKVNTVLMSGLDDAEWDRIRAFVAERPVAWRFIELMRTNDNADWRATEAQSGDLVRTRLAREGWVARPRKAGTGPAVDYAHPDHAGTIGLIAPYAHGFCDSCNRLRLSSRGKLHLCLFGEGGLDLRPLLQHDEQLEELIAAIRRAMPNKAAGHRLREGDSGATPHLASIGG